MHAWLAALTNALGGSSYPATTVMLRGFPERDAVFLRMALGGLLFAPFVWRARARIAALDARDRALCAAAGLLGYALPMVLGTYGQKLSSATSASLLIGMEPVTIVLLSALFLRERLNGLKLLALGAGLAGATLIAFQGPPRLAGAFSDRLKGDLILALHGACWALYTVIAKPVLRRLRPMDFSALTAVLAAAGAAAWAALEGVSPAGWSGAPASSWLAVAYLAVFVTFLGSWIWNVALTGLDASSQANFIFLQPVVGVLIGVGLLGDPFTRWTAAGGALVLAGVWAAHRA